MPSNFANLASIIYPNKCPNKSSLCLGSRHVVPILQTRSGAICPAGVCRGDLVAETPVLRRGSAGGYGFQGAVGHFGLLLVCRVFAAAQNDCVVVTDIGSI